MSTLIIILSFLLLLRLPLHHAAIFDIINHCPYTVWAAAVPGGGRKLNSGQNWTINVNARMDDARIWARTNCTFNDSGHGNCQTGDCNGLLECQTYGTPPNTLARFTLNGFNNLDFIDISLAEGFNVPMDFSPTAGCDQRIRCTADINGLCPTELQSPGGGCNDPCTVFKTDEYCCYSGYNCADHDTSLLEILKSATDSTVDLDVRKDNGSDSGSESGEDFEKRLVDVTFINYSSDYDEEREQARDNVNKYVQLKRSIQDNVDESDNEDGDEERPVDCLARTSEAPPVTEDGKVPGYEINIIRTLLSMHVTKDNIGSSGQKTQEGRKSKGKQKVAATSKGKEKRKNHKGSKSNEGEKVVGASKGKEKRVSASERGSITILRGYHTRGPIIGREVPQNSSFITASELMAQRNRRIVAAKI
ncbi:hypothetical protein J5N97_008686 [Dioscorea zingiberensis]|uniref:Uncharacterized protein n=1 Tax=Dioscorea zingiberensis TaxID=325984 RepID=A0A9D5HL90_9LILI|nr:hypothetical protein J5N97_008686 [Dioscorea zingiberensis]